MKRIVLLLLICFTALSCSNSATYTLEANTDHDEDQKVFFNKNR